MTSHIWHRGLWWWFEIYDSRFGLVTGRALTKRGIGRRHDEAWDRWEDEA
jgi:hypothetical protein